MPANIVDSRVPRILVPFANGVGKFSESLRCWSYYIKSPRMVELGAHARYLFLIRYEICDSSGVLLIIQVVNVIAGECCTGE